MSKSTDIEIQEKPLNQSQLKNLRELVSGDFIDLAEQIEADITRRSDRKIEEIKDRYQDESDLEGYRARLIQMKRDFEDKFEDLLTEAREQGIEVKKAHRSDRVYEIQVDEDLLRQSGRDEEIEKVRVAARDMKSTARRVLNREERSIQRQCLLQGIGATGAHELIRDLPEREDVMSLVAAELALHDSESMERLLSEDEKAQAEIETNKESK